MIERAVLTKLAAGNYLVYAFEVVDFDAHALRRLPARHVHRMNRNAARHWLLLKT
jgi:hypothetical protein